jgi:methylated-DNA-protein-cysteine methyltransferase-like protein
MAENHKASFFDKVYGILARVPSGQVVSYGQIARMLGSPRAARTVGWALSVCPESLPWQRVVRSDGSIAGGGFAELRRKMLLEEGVTFLDDDRVDMEKCQWTGVCTAVLTDIE